jgi:preprotein translocase subunit SecB
MAEENNNPDNRQVSIITQYTKDISFESPNSPQSLQPSEAKPNINVSVDVSASKKSDDVYEVELKIGAKADRSDENLFLAEVSYAGLFQLIGIPENELQPALLIFCPSLLFPYVRRIVSDLTRDGGYPALMLDPIDFAQLYQQRAQQAQQAEQNAQSNSKN